MRKALKFGIITALYLGTSALSAANAGKFDRHPNPNEPASLIYYGTIVKGDAAKLERVVASRWRSRGVGTNRIYVDLDGGQVMESMKVADVMQKYGMEIVVADNRHCVSACLNMFAAASKRWFTPHAYIGVHAALSYSTSEYGAGMGRETIQSRSATLAVAEIWATYNVPAGIIVKMMATSGHDVTWLSADDLVENNWATMYE